MYISTRATLSMEGTKTKFPIVTLPLGFAFLTASLELPEVGT